MSIEVDAVTWQVASFAVLGSRARRRLRLVRARAAVVAVLALVAALAALAALGRVAFAPLPNVKPTTDIVLLSGFALGGAPGFAVGADRRARVEPRLRPGPVDAVADGAPGGWSACSAPRWARRAGGAWAACRSRSPAALAGLLFGAIMDYSTWVTFSGAHTLGGYLAFSATSLSFNLAHAVGNVVFCLAFGPAFVRALLRFRARFEIALGAGRGGGARRARGARRRSRRRRRAATPASYLRSAQNRDGGFGAAKGQALHAALLGVGGDGAGGRTGAATRAWRATSRPARRASARRRRHRAHDPRARRAAAPRRAAPTAPISWHGCCARARRDGSWDGLVNRTAFAVLALRAAGGGERQVRAAVRWLGREPNRDGGFSFARRGVAERDRRHRRRRPGARRRRPPPGHRRCVAPLRFLVARQNPDGGFPLQPGGPSNAQSTAWAVQALVAGGRDPGRVRRGGSRTPLAYLRTLTAGDGSVRYSRTSSQTPVWVTAQALTALARRPFPIRAPRG